MPASRSPAPADVPVAAATAPLSLKPLVGKTELNDLLWETATYVELMGEAALAGTSLSLAASGMLASIGGEPGITVAEMSRRIPKTQQAISQVAARLEKLGWVERRLGSGRGVGLHLTDEGRRMSELGLERERELQVRLHELLGEERYESLRELLTQARAILAEIR